MKASKKELLTSFLVIIMSSFKNAQYDPEAAYLASLVTKKIARKTNFTSAQE